MVVIRMSSDLSDEAAVYQKWYGYVTIRPRRHKGLYKVEQNEWIYGKALFIYCDVVATNVK